MGNRQTVSTASIIALVATAIAVAVVAMVIRCAPTPAGNGDASAPAPAGDASGLADAAGIQDCTSSTCVTLTNLGEAPVTVYLAFGSDSIVTAASLSSWCAVTSALTCDVTLAPGGAAAQVLPNPAGAYLNATISADGPVTCGMTKAELNVNNPAWYDTLDVSLVDGWNSAMAITYMAPGSANADASTSVTLGPAAGPKGNEKVFGVFPLGCDLCTARAQSPCGMSPGTAGCKGGTQYKPDVPCQFQGPLMSGGGTVNVLIGAPDATR